MSTDFTTDDDEHIYIRPKVKFDQTETETEDQVPFSTSTLDQVFSEQPDSL